MAVPSLPFLVTTRMIAGFVAVIPLYVVGLLSSLPRHPFIATGYFGQSAGTYDHYFHLFLPPSDVLWSFGKVLVFAVVIIADPLLLRLQRQRRPGRRRRRGRPGRADGDRRDQHRRLLPVAWPSGAPRRPSGSRGERCACATRRASPGSVSAARSASRSCVVLAAAGRACRSRMYRKAFTPVAWVTLQTDQRRHPAPATAPTSSCAASSSARSARSRTTATAPAAAGARPGRRSRRSRPT